MSAFWGYAREMLNYRLPLVLALLGAVISAGCFGAGIGTVPLMFDVIFGEGGQTLQELLRSWDDKAWGWIPDQWISILPSDSFGSMVVVLSGVMILTVIGASAKFVHSYFALSVGIRTVADVRRRAFVHLIHLPLRTVIEKGTADRMSRIVKDTNRLRAGFNALSTKAIVETLKGVVALMMALFFSWQLTLIALIGAPILAVVVRKFSKLVQRASKRALQQSGRMLGAMTEAVQGIRVVKVHTAELHEDERFGKINDRLLNEELSMRLAKALSSPVVELISMVGIIGIAILAAWFLTQQNIEPKHAFGALLGVALAGSAVRPLTSVMTEVHESAAAAERLSEMLAESVEVQRDPKHLVLPDHRKAIEFRRVSFQYPATDQPALSEITFAINHGETVAFVGPNGSGKTTLLSLIPRLFDPQEGMVLIDEVDLQTVQLKSLRDQIGVVTQETVIFHDSIANNITYGANGFIEKADVERAAKQAYADEFIRSKPDQYETMVGEQGATLSGGERQRIAIARAILRNPRILILDEATSMIDAESEALIAEALVKFCQDRTSLVIAHRLSTVVNADRIVVMEAGRMIDVGTHGELLERCGLYQQLCRTQLVDGNENGNGNGVRVSSMV